jgi:hypothetical protein
VGCHDFDVFDLSLAIRSLVFDSNVREMDVAVDHGKVVGRRPGSDVGGMPIGVLFLPATLPFQVVQEPLVVPL